MYMENDANTTSKIPFRDILHRIEQADGLELNDLLRFIRQIYHSRFPGEEVVFVSLPKHDAIERKRIVEAIFEQLERESR